MCAGHPPFRAETPLAVLRRVCDDNPRPLREINPEIPTWLESIISRLHAKHPAKRYQTASEVADLLGRCLAHVQQPLASALPDELITPATGTDSQRWHPLPWAVLLLVIAASAGGALGLRLWRLREPADRSREIIRPSPSAPRAPAWAEQTRSEADEISRQIDDTRARTRSIDADLHHGDLWNDCDRVSALVGDLSCRGRSLEGEIAPNNGAGPRKTVVPGLSPPPNNVLPR
jgi:serine/threonine-protein kinase